MTIRKRKIFVYILFFVFIGLGGGVALYSQGFRFDYREIALRKVGGIFIRSEPSDALIFLNGLPIKNKTWLLQNGTLINNLLPGTYQLDIQRGGYWPWRKTVIVQSALVTEVDAVVLIKSDPPAIAETDVEDIWFGSGNLVVKQINGSVFLNDRNISEDAFLELSHDGKFALVKNEKSGTFFLTGLEGEQSALNIDLLLKNLRARILKIVRTEKILKVAFDPTTSDRLLALTDRALYLVNKERLTISALELDGASYFKLSGEDALWQNAKNQIWRYSLTAGRKELIATGVSDLADIASREGPNGLSFWYLRKNGSLAMLGVLPEGSVEIANQAMLFSFSPDNQRIAFVDQDGRVNIEHLRSEGIKQSFVLPIEGVIESFEWYRDSEHIIISYEDGRLYFAEIDGIMPVNSYLLGKNIKKSFYDTDKNVLHMLKDDELLRFDF